MEKQKPQIYVQRINGRTSPAVPARLSFAAHGPGCIITIQTSDGLAIRLAATHHSFLAVIGPMLEDMRRDLPNDDPAKDGVIRGDLVPSARQFTTAGIDPRPGGRKPQAHELTGDPDHDWPLWVATFGQGGGGDFAVMKDFFKMYYKVDPDKLQAEDEPVPALVDDGLGQDLALVRPHLRAIIQDGLFVRGYQSRIAEAIGITNSGVSNRRRIQRVEQALARKFLSSSSSSAAGQAESRSTDKTQAA